MSIGEQDTDLIGSHRMSADDNCVFGAANFFDPCTSAVIWESVSKSLPASQMLILAHTLIRDDRQ